MIKVKNEKIYILNQYCQTCIYEGHRMNFLRNRLPSFENILYAFCPVEFPKCILFHFLNHGISLILHIYIQRTHIIKYECYRNGLPRLEKLVILKN